MNHIDLNCDMGEIEALAANGTQDALLKSVSSVNVSCGAHAGSAALIDLTIRAAAKAGVAVGAHPGFPDRENFGRVAMALPPDELEASIRQQLDSFEAIAQRAGVPVSHVKPHGALYNVAVQDRGVAEAIARAVRDWRSGAVVMGLNGSPMLDTFRDAGLRPVGEAFADRAYEPDGTLRSRALPGALIDDPQQAGRQALRLASEGAATICIHSDTRGSALIAAAVRATLLEAGWLIKAFRSD